MEKEDCSKLSKGEAATFKIIEFNKEFKRVVASHTVLFKEQEMKNVKRASAKVAASNSEKATLGDLDALANLKDKMEKDE
jgi:small subunit ribosomal protein S1